MNIRNLTNVSRETLPTDIARTWNNCPICNTDRRILYVSFKELDFSQCHYCGCVYKSREVGNIISLEFYEKSYFHGRKSARDKRFKHRVNKNIRHIKSALEFVEAKDLLDIGCSFGYVLEAAKQLGMDAYGSDISSYAVKKCIENGYQAKTGTLESLQFSDQSFDLVTMKHVFEHTPEPKSALTEIRRVLRSRGCVLITVPDLNYWKGRLLRKIGRYFKPNDLGRQHYVYYTENSLRKLLEKANFVVCANSKAVFPGKLFQEDLLKGARAFFYWFSTKIVQALAKWFYLRREIFMIAIKK